MNTRLRWRIVVTVAVTFGISIFAWYPFLADRYGLPNPAFILEKRLRLGLDLKGGVHMVLRVNTDDAVLVETRNTAGRLDEALTRQGVKRGPIEVLGPGRFRVAGVIAEDDRAFRRVSDEVASGFDRESGLRGTYTFTIARDALASLRTNTVDPGHDKRSNGGSTSSASRSRSSPSRARPQTKSSCSCRASRTWIVRETSLARRRCSNGSSSNAGPPRRARPCSPRPAVWFRPTLKSRRRLTIWRRATARPYYLVRSVADITGTRSAQRATDP